MLDAQLMYLLCDLKKTKKQPESENSLRFECLMANSFHQIQILLDFISHGEMACMIFSGIDKGYKYM